MSNDVRGYIELLDRENLILSISTIKQKHDVGIGSITIDELYNFPESTLPPSNERNFIFVIGDDDTYYNASYLIDYLNYAPEADIGFPADPKERLDILINTLIDMIKLTNATKMVVAMTECNQIETIKKINFSEMREVIHADFDAYQAPPDTLYEIIC